MLLCRHHKQPITGQAETSKLVASGRPRSGFPQLLSGLSWSLWGLTGQEELTSCQAAYLRLHVCTDFGVPGAEAEERSRAGHRMTLYNEERRSWLQPWKRSTQGLDAPVCSMVLPPALSKAWAGPRIRMQLPSFSGATAECPQLLQYTCQLCTNVRAVPAAIVEVRASPPGLPGSMPCSTPCAKVCYALQLHWYNILI